MANRLSSVTPIEAAISVSITRSISIVVISRSRSKRTWWWSRTLLCMAFLIVSVVQYSCWRSLALLSPSFVRSLFSRSLALFSLALLSVFRSDDSPFSFVLLFAVPISPFHFLLSSRLSNLVVSNFRDKILMMKIKVCQE